MQTIYLSHFIDEQVPAYGGKEGLVTIRQSSSIMEGKKTNELRFSMPNHIGTHIDFPYHFFEEGRRCSDYPASFWVFSRVGYLSCTVEELPLKMKELPGDIELLLLQTGFGMQRHQDAYWAAQPVIPASYAGLLRERFPSLRVFGFDMISLTSKLDREEGARAHLAFLREENILVLEDMDLSALTSTPEQVVIAPLQLKEADGAPCTVIARW